MNEKIGFIGVGSQGGPMAHRLVDAGMDLTVWARRPEALEAYVAKGAHAAASVAEMGATCDHVGICVVNDADVFQITEQLVPVMRKGSRIAIHSTILPESCITLAEQCAARGIGLIDAPVSGGSPAAEAGTLTVMCGAAQADFTAAKPVFEAFGKLIVLLGSPGAGQRAKIVNNAMLSAHLGIAHHALAAGEALGIDRKAMAELVGQSSGRSMGFEIYSRMPQPPTPWLGGPLLVKDMKLLQAILPGSADVEKIAEAASSFFAATEPK
jgi:3-hydroxyisobutyrate dehydrogenase-like beta-hydroxyacid dehydrogenase